MLLSDVKEPGNNEKEYSLEKFSVYIYVLSCFSSLEGNLDGKKDIKIMILRCVLRKSILQVQIILPDSPGLVEPAVM